MLKGSCLCRRVSYQAGQYAGPYVYCHCGSCRKASGSAFAANVAVPIDDFEVLTGADHLKGYESSPGKVRYFCSHCGSPLFTKVGESPRVVRVRLGTLDTEFGDPPVAHIFVDENPPWHEIADGIPQFSGWPDRSMLPISGSRQDSA
jgi:hypothetical protein